MINRLCALSSLKNIHWRKFISTFLTFILLLASFLGIILYFHAKESTDHHLKLILPEQQMQINLVRTLLHRELNNLSSNLLVFTSSPDLIELLANPQEQTNRQRVNENLSNFIQKTEDYCTQIQAFDNNGRELVRVEKKGKQTAVIPLQELESKAADNFLDSLQLQGRGQATISPITLARDTKGQPIRPFRPLFRMAAPIFGQHQQKIGTLLFTCQGQPLLDLFTRAMAYPHNRGGLYISNNPQILNQEGYWLLASDKEDEWGFARDPQRRFDRSFPEVWKAMRDQGQGQLKTADGLFTFATMPLAADKETSRKIGSAQPTARGQEVQQDAPPFLILLTQIFPEELSRLNNQTQRSHLFMFLIVILASLPLFFWLTILLRNSREDKKQLQAATKQTTHLNILLQTIIQIHRLIDQEKDQQGLVQVCCNILVASRGYASAWILLLDTNGKIETSASSGLLDNFDHLSQQINQGNLPPCIRECRERQGLTVIDSPATFCTACRMANTYPRTGVMCTALKHDSHLYGYLNVSLPFGFTRDQEEKDLFSEISSDIGYALFNLDQQQINIEAERSLRRNKEQLRGITDSAQDAILMMDPQGAISFWNPAAEALLGYRAQEALGRNLHTLLAPSRYHGAQQAAFPEFLRSGHGSFIGKTIEVAALRKDGREIPIALSLSAVFQDKKWHAVGILRDMTERKLMEERMLQSEKMTIIAGLAAGVAHEINTPLSAILQSIQVIRQSLDPELARNKEISSQYDLDLAKVQEYFQKREINFFMDGIRDSALKSAKIIADLLQFSRPQRGEYAREDLALLLDKSLELAKNDYELKKKYDILNIEIVREYTPNLPLVSCVAIEIEQVFINLLKNAAQAMADRPEPRPKPRIILRTLHHQEMVRVEIEDNGPGMDKETRLHIFNPFFTTKDVGVGTGLGLSVSYIIIVTKHGGQLTVLSEPGQGATFIIDLPLNNDKLYVNTES